MTFEKAVEQLGMGVNNAFDVARAKKESGRPTDSVAYDQGRITGWREALGIVYQVDQQRHREVENDE